MIILIISDRKSITDHLIDAITDFVDHEVMSLTSSECTPVKLSTLKNIDLIIHDINQLTKISKAIRRRFTKSIFVRFPKIEPSEINNWVKEVINPNVDDYEKTSKNNTSIENTLDELEDKNIPLANSLTAIEKRIGDYELTRFIKSENETEVHEALQISINRKVSLTLLKRDLSQSITSIESFRETVREKAKVSHPNIAAVYEGHENDGYLFYTSELIDGQSLENAIDCEIKFNQEQIISFLKVIVETQLYLKSRQIPHASLRISDIYINSDGTTRIANTATKNPTNFDPEKLNIQQLIKCTKQILDIHLSPKISSFLDDLCNNTDTLTWERFAEKISSYERQISYIIESSSEEPEKKNSYYFLALIFLFLSIITIGIYFKIDWENPQKSIRQYQDLMVRVDGGEFIYQNGEIKTLPTFWIDRYETTISDYKKFLDAIQLENVEKYEHPEQPAEKITHEPKYWDQYYHAAKLGKPFSGHLISLDSPVIYVDWWDAYAYSKWKGRRLPTEEEWEKSARSKFGNIYPWGNNSLPSLDITSNDKFTKWIPVNLVERDITKEGIVGLMSNVSEWTITLEKDPKIIGNFIPVIRGGNFKTNEQDPNQLLDRKAVKNKSHRSELIGFRTLTDINPEFKVDNSK